MYQTCIAKVQLSKTLEETSSAGKGKDNNYYDKIKNPF